MKIPALALGVSGIAMVVWILSKASAKRMQAAQVDRIGGVDAFAASLRRPADDPIVRAAFGALVAEGGKELERVRSDDDLIDLYGIVDEDLDELVEAAAAILHVQDRLPEYCRMMRATGRAVETRTPARLVQLLDHLVEWSASR